MIKDNDLLLNYVIITPKTTFYYEKEIFLLITLVVT